MNIPIVAIPFRKNFLSGINSFVVFLSVICSVVLFFEACHPAKRVAIRKPISDLKAENLEEKMDSGEFKFNWLNAKISATATSNGKSNSFTISMRVRHDSIIWLSISSLGIEAARMVISRDSLKLVDRINSKYVVADFSYLNKILEVTADFDMVQSLLVGNYFPYLDARKLRSSYAEENYYILSTLRKRKLKRQMEEKDPNKRIIQDVWLDPTTFRIIKMIIDDNKINKKLIAKYEDFRTAESTVATDTIMFPFKSSFVIEAAKPAELSLEYSKVVMDKEQEFPFSIPEKYERMK